MAVELFVVACANFRGLWEYKAGGLELTAGLNFPPLSSAKMATFIASDTPKAKAM
jgi:hypothetical protein